MKKKIRNILKFVSGTACALVIGSTVQAGTISGVSVIDSSQSVQHWDDVTSAGLDFNPSSLVDGSGPTSTDPADMWLSRVVYEGEEFGYVLFDLGAAYSLSGTTIWNYNEVGNTGWGTNGLTISGANEGWEVYPYGGAVGFTEMAALSLSEAPGNDGNTGQSVALDGAYRYILFELTSSFNGMKSNTVEYLGLSEVQFQGNLAQTPVPAAALMFVPAVVGGAAVARRRRKA